ncbi:MAG: hydroxyphenylacetyl-CoA thioesterase PaaI [Burkholderiaceae bacterium]
MNTAADPADAQALAERVRDAMFAKDVSARALGMRVDAVGRGSASVSMTVREDMLNGFAICHGGLVATLADTAFAYACNSANHVTVASSFEIDLLTAAHAGDRLDAQCNVVSQGARVGLYDVEVLNQRGERVAVFRGRSYRLHGRSVVD